METRLTIASRNEWRGVLIKNEDETALVPNTLTQLPDLREVLAGEGELSKDFNDDLLREFFVTQDLKHLADRTLRSSAGGRGRNSDGDGAIGTFVHGNHGLGKSSALYMTACIGWCLGHCVWYIPSSQRLLEHHTADGCAQYAITLFYQMNEDILKSYNIGVTEVNLFKHGRRSPLLIAEIRNLLETRPWNTQTLGILLDKLRLQAAIGVVIVLDECHLLYPEHVPPHLKNVFRGWQNWARFCGARTYTIRASSAHQALCSNYTHDNERHLDYHLTPMTTDSLRSLMKICTRRYTTPHSVWQSDDNGDYFLHEVHQIAGGVFRHTEKLLAFIREQLKGQKKIGNSEVTAALQKGRGRLAEIYLASVKQEWDRLQAQSGVNMERMVTAASSYLRRVLRGNQRVTCIPYEWHDSGIVVRASQGSVCQIVNLAARDAIFQHLQNIDPRTNFIIPRHILGEQLESTILDILLTHEVQVPSPQFLCSSLCPRAWTCHLPRTETITITRFGQCSSNVQVQFDVAAVREQRKLSDVILIPTSGTCPAWDFFVVHRQFSGSPATISCVQVTRTGQTYADGTLKLNHRETLEKWGHKVATKVCDKLWPGTGTTVHLEDREFVLRSSMLPIPDVNFVLITLADIRKLCEGRAHNYNRYPCPIKNIIIFGRRELENHFHVSIQ